MLSWSGTAASADAQCRVYTTNADFDLGVLAGVNHSFVNDQLQLDTTSTTFRFAWIANAEDGTVSKVDTETGKEVARYWTGPFSPGGANSGGQSPSRTAVDGDGNCWVANRHFGGQSSITEILVDGGVDRDLSGTIETSRDLNNDGVISGAELLPWGSDERVARHYLVGGGSGLARALTIDKSGSLWVGLYSEQRVIKLDPDLSTAVYAPLNGNKPSELASVPTSTTYGLVTAPNGRLYLSTLSNVVQEIDPGAVSGGTDPARVLQTQTFDGLNYGIAADRNGIVWMADLNNNRPIRWDPSLGAGGFTYGAGAASRGRGITVDFDGNIWMACDIANSVAKYTPTAPPVLLFNAAAGATFPSGVGVTGTGEIIAVGQNSNSWGKIDHLTGALIATGGPQLVGNGPYTYSDFTGSLRSIIKAPQGFWTVIQDGGANGFKWGKVLWTSLEPESTTVAVEVRASDDSSAAGLGTQTYVPVTNGVAFSLLGRFIQVRARLSTDRGDLQSPILYDLAVCPGNLPPDCSDAVASEPILWPPNHAYHAISVLGVTDPDGDPVTVTVTKVTQDEPVNTRGDGNTCPDARIVSGQASVRAERAGTPGLPGNGRVYAISFTADDGKGGQCTGTVYACVPHDQGDPTCLDDGQRFASTGDCRSGDDVRAEITEFDLRVAAVVGSSATIDFALPTDTAVEVSVFDLAGRRLATLENSRLTTGLYQRTWSMDGVARGMYFVRMRAGSTTLTKAVVKTR